MVNGGKLGWGDECAEERVEGGVRLGVRGGEGEGS